MNKKIPPKKISPKKIPLWGDDDFARVVAKRFSAKDLERLHGAWATGDLLALKIAFQLVERYELSLTDGLTYWIAPALHEALDSLLTGVMKPSKRGRRACPATDIGLRHREWLRWALVEMFREQRGITVEAAWEGAASVLREPEATIKRTHHKLSRFKKTDPSGFDAYYFTASRRPWPWGKICARILKTGKIKKVSL